MPARLGRSCVPGQARTWGVKDAGSSQTMVFRARVGMGIPEGQVAKKEKRKDLWRRVGTDLWKLDRGPPRGCGMMYKPKEKSFKKKKPRMRDLGKRPDSGAVFQTRVEVEKKKNGVSNEVAGASRDWLVTGVEKIKVKREECRTRAGPRKKNLNVVVAQKVAGTPAP